MTKPTTAFILAAGFGSRLRPMTNSIPKPLMPIWNRPMLEHIIEMLENWGVKKIILNTHHLHESIENWSKTYSGKCKIILSYEPEIFGTGGALRPIEKFLADDEPFFMVNGDIAAKVNPELLWKNFEESGYFASTWLEPVRGPRTVEMDYKGRITNYASPTPAVPHTYTLCGVHVLNKKKILQFLPKEKSFCSIIDAFNNAMQENLFVYGVVDSESYWNDAGTLANYIAIHNETSQPNHIAAHYLRDREKIPEAFLIDAIKKMKWNPLSTICIPMGVRGSKRSFWRIVNGTESAIAIQYSPDRVENIHYAAALRVLKKTGVNVPEVLKNSRTKNYLVLQDLGDESFEKTVNERKDSDEIPSNITEIIKQLVKFHNSLPAVVSARLKLEPPFTFELYTQERELFEKYWMEMPQEAVKEWLELVQKIQATPTVLVHRDFQSSNIIFKDKKPYFIDIQGMRRGSAFYDLASFVYDPYVTLTEAERAHAIQTYLDEIGVADEGMKALVIYAGIQRLLQALGAYKRLISVGQVQFGKYIPQAFETIIELTQKINSQALCAFLIKARNERTQAALARGMSE